MVVSFQMWIFAKLKLWEVLLMVAICLLAALVYETHNAPGRYVYTGLEYFTGVEFSEIYLDTATGIQWYLKPDSTGKHVWVKWNESIPNRSHSLD